MAVTTLTTTGAEDTRIAAVAGADLGLGRNANAAESKQWVGNLIRDRVKTVEDAMGKRAAIAAFVPAAPIAPT